MTDNNPEPRPAFLEGARATDWFYGVPGGGLVLDRHLVVLQAVFGPEVPYRIRAAIDPFTAEPGVLIIEVLLPVDDETAWEQLVDLEERLLAEERNIVDATGQERPFGRIVVCLAGPPSHWTNIVDEIDNLR